MKNKLKIRVTIYGKKKRLHQAKKIEEALQEKNDNS